MQRCHSKKLNLGSQSQSIFKRKDLNRLSANHSIRAIAKQARVSKAQAKSIMKHKDASQLAMRRSSASSLTLYNQTNPDSVTLKQTKIGKQNMSGPLPNAFPSPKIIDQQTRGTNPAKNVDQSDRATEPDKRNLSKNRGELLINIQNYQAHNSKPGSEPKYPYTRSCSHTSQIQVQSTYQAQASDNDIDTIKSQIVYLTKLRLKMQKNIFLLFQRIELEMNLKIAAPPVRMIVLGKLVALQTEKVAKISMLLEQLVLQLKKAK